MALRCLAHIKKEGDFIILQELKEEPEESELCPSAFFFYFKQEEEEEEIKPDILKQPTFGLSTKQEEPLKHNTVSSSESIALTSPGPENVSDVPSVEYLEDVPHAQRMQLWRRICVEKTVSGPFVPNGEVTDPTGPTPSSSPCQTESEEEDDDDDDDIDNDDIDDDDDIIDPNWTLPEVPQAHCKGQENQTPRRPRGRPRKNCSDPKAVHKKSTSESVKDSCSARLNKKDLHASLCKKKKKQCNKKMEKTEQSATGLKSGTPRTAVCKTCHKAFLSKRDLQRHERTHTGAKPFKCSVCERDFNDLGNMHKHMLVHTGAQPFNCKLCGRAFSERGNLQRHEFYVHKIQVENQRQWEPLWHQCPACLRTFKYQRSLIRHMESYCNGKSIGQRPNDMEKVRNTKATKNKKKETRKELKKYQSQ